MGDILIYISILVHVVLIILLWRIVYHKMKPKRSRLNKSIWVSGLIALFYVIIISNIALKTNGIWFDNIFFAPSYLLFYFLFFTLLFNLGYSVVLFIRKENGPVSKR